MGARRRPWRGALAGLVASAMTATATAAAGCGAQLEAEHREERPPAADVSGEVTGDVTVEARDGVVVPAASIAGVEAITPMLDVSTDGAVTGEVEIRAPLTRTTTTTREGSSDLVVFALAAESAEGPWEVVPAEVDGGDVVITTTHLSLFQAFRALVTSIGDLAKASWDGLTSDVFAEATPPNCDDEDGARTDGYDLASDHGDAVFWCFGRSAHGRYLRVVNNRRYALLLDHGAGLTVVEQDHLGVDIVERLSRALTLDHQVAVAPRGQVTFRVDVDPGSSTRVTSQFDGSGSALAQLQMGFETLVTILNRFGAGPPAGSSEARRKWLELLDNASCIEAAGSGNPGTIVAGCFGVDELRDVFGTGAAVLLTPLVTAGSLVTYFQSQLNALGDQFNNRDAYTVTIERQEAEAEPLPPPPPTLPEMRDDHLGPLTIGMALDEAQSTGWLGTERQSCAVSLGIDPEGHERMFMLDGPESPAALDGYAVLHDNVVTELVASNGARVGGAFDLPSGLTLPEVATLLEQAGYTTEISTVFEPDDYLMATEADGDTLAVVGPVVGQAGIPQDTPCD